MSEEIKEMNPDDKNHKKDSDVRIVCRKRSTR